MRPMTIALLAAVLAMSCKEDEFVAPPPIPAVNQYVYVQTNDPEANGVMVFGRLTDGRLTSMPIGVFITGGRGLSAGPEQRPGPLDLDRPLALSTDKRYLLSVNPGSDTIAVFRTSDSGALSPVSGSPFPSGGRNPVSLAVLNERVYVVNKAVDGTTPPSIVLLILSNEGALSPALNATVQTPIGGSPSVAMFSPTGRFLWTTQFYDAARADLAPAGQIDVFGIDADGRLNHAPGSPFPVPPDTSGLFPAPESVALNLAAHPSRTIVYVGFPTRNQVGVYTYDDVGRLAFVRAAPNSGKGVSQLLVSNDGNRLYTSNPGSGTMSFYDLTVDPQNPLERASLPLKSAMLGPPFVDAAGNTQNVTSQPAQLAFDEGQTHVYVVSQRVTTNPEDPVGNFLHTLDVQPDGSLVELADPIDLNVTGIPATARPQGVIVN